MTGTKTTWGWRVILVALLTLGAFASTATAADQQSSNPDQPVKLQGMMTGRLEPSVDGNFAYYTFEYPGGRQIVSVNAQLEPEIPRVFESAGFRVYGPQPGRVYAQSGAQPSRTPNVTADLVSDDAGWYVIQIYNYAPTVPVGYTVWTRGLPDDSATTQDQPTTPVSVKEPAAAPTGSTTVLNQSDDPENAVPLTTELRGSLEGDINGEFAYYRFDYTPGTLATINLRVEPDQLSTLRNVGFRIYGPRPHQVYARSGIVPGRMPNVSADLRSNDGGVYLVQVFNYNPATPITYTIWGTGIPQREQTPMPSTDPAQVEPVPSGG